MRPIHVLHLAFAAAIFLTCGCSSNNKGKIEGTSWSSIAAVVKGISVPAGALQLDFRNDGTLRYRARGTTYTGTYSLGFLDSVNLKLDQDLAGRKDHTEKVVINGEILTMTDSDGTEISFQKVKK